MMDEWVNLKNKKKLDNEKMGKTTKGNNNGKKQCGKNERQYGKKVAKRNEKIAAEKKQFQKT